MTIESTLHIPARLHVLAATAMLLERLEQMPRSASATQYRGLVAQVSRLLDEAAGEPSLPALLDGLPALAELHENRHYVEAGLCRRPLQASIASERGMREVLKRVSGRL